MEAYRGSIDDHRILHLLDAHGSTSVNLGGLNPDGTPKIPLTLINSTRFTFTLPA
jgi:hypothetical protein